MPVIPQLFPYYANYPACHPRFPKEGKSASVVLINGVAGIETCLLTMAGIQNIGHIILYITQYKTSVNRSECRDIAQEFI